VQDFRFLVVLAPEGAHQVDQRQVQLVELRAVFLFDGVECGLRIVENFSQACVFDRMRVDLLGIRRFKRCCGLGCHCDVYSCESGPLRAPVP
jgi:hypothetical protein